MPKTKFVEGSKWRLVGRSMPNGVWTVSNGCLALDSAIDPLSTSIPVVHLYDDMWEPVDDPFVVFVREVLNERN